MSTLPTPRTDAHFDYVKTLARATANVKASLLYEKFIDGTPLENDVPVWMTLAYCEGGRFARDLERELTEAKAERDALKAEVEQLKIGKCICNCGKEVMNAWRDQDGYYCLTCLAKERDKAEADLARLRAEASKNQNRLIFLQTEGLAWPNETIDRHMQICADKRSHVPFAQS